MKKALLVISLIVFTGSFSFAGGNLKTTEVNGHVTDQQGNPLAGVKVEISGTDETVYTDFDGNFTLENVPLENQAIQLEYISFRKQELKLEAQSLSSVVQIELKSK